MKILRFATLQLITLGLLCQGITQAQTSKPKLTREDYKAHEMLNSGIELLEMNQVDRGLKLVNSVVSQFPESPIRFKAYLTLGDHFIAKRQFDTAIRYYRNVSDPAEDEVQAKAWFQVGLCYYELGRYDQAFVSLRQVTSNFPSSDSANDAYYYIGMCYFQQKRWAKAAEALAMVGTSVPHERQGDNIAEIGQRLYVKISDKDLVILAETKEEINVVFETLKGDKETAKIIKLGRDGEHYVASIETVLANPIKNDGKLQLAGGDVVTTTYIDKNTKSGKRNEKKVGKIRVASTATVAFTDGAYKEKTQGLFGDADAFVRLRDLDLDVSDKPDFAKVSIISRYKLPVNPEEIASQSPDEQEDVYQIRDRVTLTLKETTDHSGVFTGTITPVLVSENGNIHMGDDILSAVKGDDIHIEFVDKLHIGGNEPRRISAKAKCLSGRIGDVVVEHRVVDSDDLRARKNLIEAKLFLELGLIFKKVGLLEKASEKAVEGLARTDEIINLNLKVSLDRSVVEQAFRVRWDLLLVQDKLNEAIAACKMLIRLYPDSVLADQALFKIALARRDKEEYTEAIRLLVAVISLPKSELQAEAQYTIATIRETLAREAAEKSGKQINLASALSAYQKCAEQYPMSPFAGDSLARVCNYYISAKDFNRAIELLERIFQDYPDAGFLDQMLLKWGLVAYKMGDFAQANTKIEMLLAEYPGSKLTAKAQKFLAIIKKRLP